MAQATRSFVDKAEVAAAVDAAGHDLVAAIRNISDPNAPAIGTWSAGDVAAHIIDVYEAAKDIAEGRGTPFADSTETAANNESRLAARSERDPNALADAFQRALTDYVTVLRNIEGDPLVRWADFEVPVSTATAVELNEVLIHGYDITKAEGKPWKIDPARVVLGLRGIAPVTERYVDPDAAAGFTGTFDLRLRGHTQLHFVFEDGSLTVAEPADRKVDVHISADPVAFVLVGYGRISQWGPIATGKLVTWGRKPWLAFKFAHLLRNP
jgi:uncharacterized protein (TIGR03083 family)